MLVGFAAAVASTALLSSAATAVATKRHRHRHQPARRDPRDRCRRGGPDRRRVLDAGADAKTGLPAESAFVTGFAVAGLVAALSLLVVRVTKTRTTTTSATTTRRAEEKVTEKVTERATEKGAQA
ncbi:hypothetical protein [Streptomyces sp. KL116D]|uniref:hypothetical protein n=1 Tax=Streptomyces sp. KL116D TaxID=3045152 RepID=UPI00355748BC